MNCNRIEFYNPNLYIKFRFWSDSLAHLFHNHLSSYVHILPFTVSLCPSLDANISKRHSDNPPKTLGTLAPFARAIISSTLRKHSSFTPPSLCAKHSSFQRISRSHTSSQVAHKYVIPPFIPAPFFHRNINLLLLN